MSATMKSKSLPEAPNGGTLFLVATPIGHLADMTYRAVEVLKQVALIACEDTRTSRVLLEHYGITTPTFSYHEHNEQKMLPALMSRLSMGESIALISDAGTPLISDPGFKLVRAARENGMPVSPIPGANAAIAALSASGLPTDSFYFAGFPPPKTQARQRWLQQLATLQTTLIFYESPRRLAVFMQELTTHFPASHTVIAREITKHYEEFIHGMIETVAADIQARANIRGEIVVLLNPAPQEATDPATIDALLTEALTRLSTREAADWVAGQTGASRRSIYQLALQRKAEHS